MMVVVLTAAFALRSRALCLSDQPTLRQAVLSSGRFTCRAALSFKGWSEHENRRRAPRADTSLLLAQSMSTPLAIRFSPYGLGVQTRRPPRCS